jgi:hypothetical protein
MLHSPDKDTYIDAVFIEFFDRYARGNKPYYSAGRSCCISAYLHTRCTCTHSYMYNCMISS